MKLQCAIRPCCSFLPTNIIYWGEPGRWRNRPIVKSTLFFSHTPTVFRDICSSSSKSLIYQKFNYVNGFGFVNDKDVLFCKKHWFLSHRWKELRTKTGLIPEHKRDLVAAQGGGGAAFATPRPVLSSCTRPIFQPAWTELKKLAVFQKGSFISVSIRSVHQLNTFLHRSASLHHAAPLLWHQLVRCTGLFPPSMVLHLSRVFLTRVKPDYHIRLIMDRMTDSGRLMTGFNAVWFTLHWHETFTCKTSWLLFSNCNEDLVVNRALSPFCRDVTRGLSWDQPHQMHPAQKSYQPNQQRYRPEYLPTRNPPCCESPPNQIPTTTFYIFPSIRDFTHSFRFDPPEFVVRYAFPQQSFAATKCHRNLYRFSLSSTFATFVLCFITMLIAVAVEILHTFTLFIRPTFAHSRWVPANATVTVTALKRLPRQGKGEKLGSSLIRPEAMWWVRHHPRRLSTFGRVLTPGNKQWGHVGSLSSLGKRGTV